jgi:hypothetical protein
VTHRDDQNSPQSLIFQSDRFFEVTQKRAYDESGAVIVNQIRNGMLSRVSVTWKNRLGKTRSYVDLSGKGRHELAGTIAGREINPKNYESAGRCATCARLRLSDAALRNFTH